MIGTPTSSKEEKYIRVYEECLKLIHENGIKAVNHSAIARKAKVSRPWIYKYMGESKEDLIQGAAKFFGAAFTNFSLQEVKIGGPKDMLRDLSRGTANNIEFTQKYPFIVPMYVRFAGTDNVLGQTIDEIENLYFGRLVSKFRQVLHSDELAKEAATIVKAIRIGAALEFGTLCRRQLSEEEKKLAMESLNSMLKKLLKEFLLRSQMEGK